MNDERKLLFETTKEKLFVIIKEKILTDSTLLDFSKSHIHLESDRKMLSFTSNFIFYGLYFKLFTKDELCFLEQNKLLLFVANDILNEQDFLLLLKKNEIDFKNIYNVNMYSKDNYYLKENLNLVINLSTIPVVGSGLADFLLTYFDYLMNYNTVIFNNQGDINLSREQLLKPFLENIDILSKTFKLTEEEFLNILHNKLVVK